MLDGLKKIARKVKRWWYRDSKTGQFLSKDEFARRDPATTQREERP